MVVNDPNKAPFLPGEIVRVDERDWYGNADLRGLILKVHDQQWHEGNVEWLVQLEYHYKGEREAIRVWYWAHNFKHIATTRRLPEWW